MYKNYYLFKAQSVWLNDQIKGSSILECFTFRKSELVIKIANEEELFLRISINPSMPYIVLSKSQNVKESKVNLFNELIDQEIEKLSIDESDKIIKIKTESYQVKSIFFGRTPNIILNDLKNNQISQFKKEYSKPENTESSTKLNPDKLKPIQLIELMRTNKDLDIIKFLSRNINGFNYLIAKDCCFRSQIDFNNDVSTLTDSQLNVLRDTITQIDSEFKNPQPIIYYDNEFPKHLVISNMEHLEKNFQPKLFQSINQAWKIFIRQSIKTKTIDKIANQCYSVLNNRINYLKKTINKIEKFEKLEERKILSELKGNLLLTFLKKVPRGAKSVELENIFSEKKELILIKLNPAKSVQDNAQKYFEKFKDIDIQKDKIINRKTVLNNELTSLLEINSKYSNINSQKEAIKLQELLIQKNLIQSPKNEHSNREITEHKFKKIVLQNKWIVFIGKNNLNNDLLTFSFAHKNDWWFHAQGVPGSHTIIHLMKKDEIPPKDIIEDVASLAAFHSSAKHSSGVSVIYTQVRYVKRIKKANPGTVSVLQHKTIFVKPKNL